MLTIVVPAADLFDEATCEFIAVPGVTLYMEHSLVSLSKWESKWKKSWISTRDKTQEESLDYLRCMTLNKTPVPQVVYDRFPANLFNQVLAYIDDPMTGTTFTDRDKRPNREIITAEVIYHWMISLQIPFKCETWHLNRLLALIKLCNIKNAPSKKMSRKDAMSQQRALNAARRNSLGTSG